jgi:hypothetical protein
MDFFELACVDCVGDLEVASDAMVVDRFGRGGGGFAAVGAMDVGVDVGTDGDGGVRVGVASGGVATVLEVAAAVATVGAFAGGAFAGGAFADGAFAGGAFAEGAFGDGAFAEGAVGGGGVFLFCILNSLARRLFDKFDDLCSIDGGGGAFLPGLFVLFFLSFLVGVIVGFGLAGFGGGAGFLVAGGGGGCFSSFFFSTFVCFSCWEAVVFCSVVFCSGCSVVTC